MNARPSAGQMTPAEKAQMLRALQGELLKADDRRIRQIVELANAASKNEVWTALLDPLRPRLATLRPRRPLRFTRLLLTPLDGLIVPAPSWRLGQASVPRTVLGSIAETVQLAMGREADEVNRLIDGHFPGDTDIVTQAGALLWRSAGDILAQLPPPINWTASGLPLTTYAPLARAVAAVLRQATALRPLLQAADTGVLAADHAATTTILSAMRDDPREARIMVMKLILRHCPDALALFGKWVEAGRTTAEKTLLQREVNEATDAVLDDLETRLAMADLSHKGPLVERINRLMQELSADADAVRHRPRVQEISKQLDTICRESFVEGIRQGFMAPLADATAPVEGDSQQRLESCARHLRAIEMAGRKLGSGAIYDKLLRQAAETVREAAERGCLSPVRMMRLVEILLGPAEAALLRPKTAGRR